MGAQVPRTALSSKSTLSRPAAAGRAAARALQRGHCAAQRAVGGAALVALAADCGGGGGGPPAGAPVQLRVPATLPRRGRRWRQL